MCNSPAKFVQILRDCSLGRTKALRTVVKDMCEEANKVDDGLVDEDVKSPSKQQQRDASQLDPGKPLRPSPAKLPLAVFLQNC